MKRPHEPPLPEPIAYFLTWSTYGTWLPGDARGWVKYHQGPRLPDPVREREAAARMAANARWLADRQRKIVELTISDHCSFRGWQLHAANCRTNHVHVVVSADVHPAAVRRQLKAWCSRRLNELETDPSGTASEVQSNHWWAERGSMRYINDHDDLEAAIRYVRDAQDRAGPRRDVGP